MNSLEVKKEYQCQEWIGVIEDRRASGLTVKEYCTNRGISAGQYYYWLRKIHDHLQDNLK